MLLTANFILVKLITVNLEEAKLPVKNFYTSSSAMFSSGSYWDVATALSFYSPEVAPTRNLLLLDRSVNEKEPALWRVLSVWATCAGLWGLGNRGQKRRGEGSFSLSIYFSFGVFVFLNPKRVSAERYLPPNRQGRSFGWGRTADATRRLCRRGFQWLMLQEARCEGLGESAAH